MGFFLLAILAFHAARIMAQGCGSSISGTRIVGGEITGGLRYPWLAMLRLRVPGDPPVCAGTLITPNHVISAAHCFFVSPNTPKEDLFTVALGVYNRCIAYESTREIFNVTQVRIHEKYSNSDKFFDIAIMKLDRAANAVVACLPPAGAPKITEPGVIVGFGILKQGSRNQPCRQRQAHVTKLTPEQCSKTRLPAEDSKEPSVFCGGGSGIDSCQGDSGGPFMTISAEGKYIVAGIVSYGYGCGKVGLPGVYTNVESYLDWISNQISSMDRNGPNIPEIPANTVRQIPIRPINNGHSRTHLFENAGKTMITFPDQHPKVENGLTLTRTAGPFFVSLPDNEQSDLNRPIDLNKNRAGIGVSQGADGGNVQITFPGSR